MKFPQSKRQRKIQMACPFCDALLPKAEEQDNVFSGGGCHGGRCSCGAVFALDETGRLGGQAQIDALAIACDGDLDRALKLKVDEDYQLEIRSLRPASARFGAGFSKRDPAAPKLWAVRLKSS